jgi:hypothetical protein
MSVASIAADHLRATNNPSVGWGDSHLLHEIAEKAGIESRGHRTEKAVLDAIDRSNKEQLVKRYFRYPERGCGRTRRFFLPERLPAVRNGAD